jgi:hypothetical protein
MFGRTETKPLPEPFATLVSTIGANHPEMGGATYRGAVAEMEARVAESGANRGRRARRLVMSPDCGLGLVPAFSGSSAAVAAATASKVGWA